MSYGPSPDDPDFDWTIHTDFFPRDEFPHRSKVAGLELAVDIEQFLSIAWSPSIGRVDICRAWRDRPWDRAHFYLEDPRLEPPWQVERQGEWIWATHPDTAVRFGLGPSPFEHNAGELMVQMGIKRDWVRPS